MSMLAFINTTVTKDEIIAQLQDHYAADEIVKGQYWSDGKGCAIGCTLHSSEHAEYEPRFGIPQMLARLEDVIFENLLNAESKKWPLRFMHTVKPGSDLTSVGRDFLHWLLTDVTVNPGIDHPLVKDAVKQCADLYATAESATRSATRSARRAAESAAESVRRAAESAAWSAAWRAAESADSAASAAWTKMADKLIELIAAAPTPIGGL